jgi:hypothetical protein
MTRKQFYSYWAKWRSRPSLIDKIAEYIDQDLTDCSCVGIHLPDKLTLRQWQQLRERFDCKRSFFGYIDFKKKEVSHD